MLIPVTVAVLSAAAIADLKLRPRKPLKPFEAVQHAALWVASWAEARQIYSALHKKLREDEKFARQQIYATHVERVG